MNLIDCISFIIKFFSRPFIIFCKQHLEAFRGQIINKSANAIVLEMCPLLLQLDLWLFLSHQNVRGKLRLYQSTNETLLFAVFLCEVERCIFEITLSF